MMVGSTWDGSDNGEESGHGSDGGKQFGMEVMMTQDAEMTMMASGQVMGNGNGISRGGGSDGVRRRGGGNGSLEWRH